MGKVVFFEITWMKNYQGITDEDEPRNGGSFVTETGEAMECKNFLPYNHYCYGYVQQRGSVLHIDRIEPVDESVTKLEDVTVVWVARSTARKIVGWYEHATVYRELQTFVDDDLGKDNESLGRWEYYAMTKEENAYLLPEEDRHIVIPSASKEGAGKGMGQSMIWYADSDYAKETVIPMVLEHIRQAKRRTKVLCWSKEELQSLPLVGGSDLGAVMEKATELFEAGNSYEALQYYNLAKSMESSFVVFYLRGWTLQYMLLYDEAIEEYKRALQEPAAAKDYIDCMLKLAYLYTMVHKNYLAWEIYEKVLQQKIEKELKCDVIINMMLICAKEELWEKLAEIIVKYEREKTTYRADVVEDFRGILRDAQVE